MIRIRRYQKKDADKVASVIFETFKRFNSQDYFEKSGVIDYLDCYDIKKRNSDEIHETLGKSSISYVALIKDKIVGMIRGKKDKISNLYIDGCYHRMGVAKKLVDKFEQEARKQKSKKIKTKSSLYAVSFYQKMGYKKTTGLRNFMGIKVYPMKKVF